MNPPNPLLTKFTFAGRMLLLAHLLLAIGGSALYISEMLPGLPSGRYPIFVFVVPIGIAGVLSFFALAWIFERLGVPVYRRAPDSKG